MSRPDFPKSTRPVPPPRRSTWGTSDATARAFGYPPSRPPTLEARVAYLERLTAYLADELDRALDRMEMAA